MGKGITVTLTDLEDVNLLSPLEDNLLAYDGIKWKATDSLVLSDLVAQTLNATSLAVTGTLTDTNN